MKPTHFPILIGGVFVVSDREGKYKQAFGMPTLGHLSFGEDLSPRTDQIGGQACEARLFEYLPGSALLRILSRRNATCCQVVQAAWVGRLTEGAPSAPHLAIASKAVYMNRVTSQAEVSKGSPLEPEQLWLCIRPAILPMAPA